MKQQLSVWICNSNLRKLNLLVGVVSATMACVANAADFEKKISIAASVAVSYTHLDVYKRQALIKAFLTK